jgi:cation diffusion facilitator CzcD-associated flavoprotein CzcO
MHSVRYRDPVVFTGKRVLVVRGGNSGCDIACDAAQRADPAVPWRAQRCRNRCAIEMIDLVTVASAKGLS